jgi:exopolysaccharide biosynthesis protein
VRAGFVGTRETAQALAARNPRTMAGVTREGDLLLVTVDGRQPGYSVGLSFTEETRLMRALGSVQALNLDGGGSTTMAVHGTVLGRPSDATGERPIGDAILIFPPGPHP